MAGILFSLGLDGSKAKAQAEAIGKDIKKGVDNGAKNAGKDVDGLSKSLGVARSNAKQLHEDLLGLSAGGTKSMSSLVGLGGDLAKSLGSAAGIFALVTLAGSYAFSKLSEKSKQLGDIIKSYLELRLKQSEEAANRLNAVKLREFQRELESAGESIDRMSKIFAASLAAQRKLTESEAEARIALIDYQEARGTISHEQAAKARIEIKRNETRELRRLEEAETKAVLRDAAERVAAAQTAYNTAQKESRRGVTTADNVASIKVAYEDAVTRGDRIQETRLVDEFNSLMRQTGSEERLEVQRRSKGYKILDYAFGMQGKIIKTIFPSLDNSLIDRSLTIPGGFDKEGSIATASSTFTKAINEALNKTKEAANAEENLRKATQELADARAVEAETRPARERAYAFKDAGVNVKGKGEILSARSEDVGGAAKAAKEISKAPTTSDQIVATEKDIKTLTDATVKLKKYSAPSQADREQIRINEQHIAVLKEQLEVLKQTQKNTESLR